MPFIITVEVPLDLGSSKFDSVVAYGGPEQVYPCWVSSVDTSRTIYTWPTKHWQSISVIETHC